MIGELKPMSRFKRAFDVVGAWAGLIVFAPVMAIARPTTMWAPKSVGVVTPEARSRRRIPRSR